MFIALPFVLVRLLSNADDSKNGFYAGFIIFSHALIFLLWLAFNNLEIRIYQNSIAYKTLLFTREINWNEIIDVDLHLGFTGQHPHPKWTFFAGKKSINIDPSYFSRTNNRFLAEAVMSKCINAKISDTVKKIADGKFPWYLI